MARRRGLVLHHLAIRQFTKHLQSQQRYSALSLVINAACVHKSLLECWTTGAVRERLKYCISVGAQGINRPV